MSWDVDALAPSNSYAKFMLIVNLFVFWFFRHGKMSCETLLVPPFSETMEVIINILTGEFKTTCIQLKFTLKHKFKEIFF